MCKIVYYECNVCGMRLDHTDSAWFFLGIPAPGNWTPCYDEAQTSLYGETAHRDPHREETVDLDFNKKDKGKVPFRSPANNYPHPPDM